MINRKDFIESSAIAALSGSVLAKLAYQLEESKPWKNKWAPHSIVNL
ncbi:MAG: hypothetical protein HOL09_00085 [Candidatus Marinimicrobia bacterium]|jgi:hypothetical protein|nr:hypothetical protein [Candidatus Neomarinimicrobiota bacterium]MBT6390212.1 hypothetical protein [Candidatus Neomarinimicrobiota bacterium]|tara:strand:+ start:944 stop:1084 length:141 start_codon:yes stop_codon:yes gene_type:complete